MPSLKALDDEVQRLRNKNHLMANVVQKVVSDFDGHLLLCANNYKTIEDKLNLLLKLMGYAGALFIVNALAIIAFFVKQYFMKGS